MRLLVATTWLALVGCGEHGEVPADCSTVANGVKKYWADRAEVATSATERSEIRQMSEIAAERLERHCRADLWSDDMIGCARAVFRLDDSGCMKFLSSQQKAKLAAGEPAPRIEGGIGLGN